MKPTVIAAAAFAVGSVVLGWWLLSRPRPPAFDLAVPETPALDTFTFAAWAARSDAVLLVEMQQEGSHFTPKRFHIVDVAVGPDGTITTTPGVFLSWAQPDRIQTTSALLDRVFPFKNDEYRQYPPFADPLTGDAPRGDAGTEQQVTLRSKEGLVATLRRRRSGPGAVFWGKRALGFPSSDEKLAYVLPDAVVIPIGAPTP